ncbi:uncharacterized protein LOC114535326 [Dendronephthya gigantea]|uniref:uncharacterized protein LOC114535326 n=1 Tax=Dendronephthya gigantea TaxID=151771 RepID=UPI00106D9C9D|nr:uncharacterized protein LOC114535326 [Dendronephthya gigantea]
MEEEKRDLSIENSSLKTQVMDSVKEINIIKDKLNNLEQYIRRDCVEIRGIPNQGSESVRQTNEIVQRICEKIGLLVDCDIISHRLPVIRGPLDINFAHQVNRPQLSQIQLLSNSQIGQYFGQYRRSLRDITTRDLGFQAQNKIFIVESLTPKNKEIFNGCLGVKRDKRFKFLWTNMGKIYQRRDEKNPRTLVSCLNDLEELAR